MSSEWVAVVQDEGDDPIEIPSEQDGTLLLTSITAQFPATTGLKFRNPETKGMRGVRLQDNTLFPPHDDGKWGSQTYICVQPKAAPADETSASGVIKRKAVEDLDDQTVKLLKAEEEAVARARQSSTTDLICLGLPFKTPEDVVRAYFEKFGELYMCQLKQKANGMSKGYAFVRFKDIDVQKKVLMTRHMIDDRWCDVKVPESQEPDRKPRDTSCKIFVARISDDITKEDLREHFEKFGQVTDVFYPRPFRGFAFVTFVESKVALSLLDRDHLIKGVSVHIGSATPKMSTKEMEQQKLGRLHGAEAGYYGSVGSVDPWAAGSSVRREASIYGGSSAGRLPAATDAYGRPLGRSAAVAEDHYGRLAVSGGSQYGAAAAASAAGSAAARGYDGFGRALPYESYPPAPSSSKSYYQ